MKKKIAAIIISFLLIIVMVIVGIFLLLDPTDKVIEGYVYDGVTSEPVENCEILLFNDDYDWKEEIAKVRTDPDGYFKYSHGSIDDIKSISVVNERYFSSSIRFTSYGKDQLQEIYLEPLGVLNGEVTINNSTGMEDIYVCIKKIDDDAFQIDDHEFVKSVIIPLDNDGNFNVPKIEWGEFLLNINSRMYPPSNWYEIGINDSEETNEIYIDTGEVGIYNLLVETDQDKTDLPILIMKNDEIIGGGIANPNLNLSLKEPGKYTLLIDHREGMMEFKDSIDIKIERKFTEVIFDVQPTEIGD